MMTVVRKPAGRWHRVKDTFFQGKYNTLCGETVAEHWIEGELETDQAETMHEVDGLPCGDCIDKMKEDSHV